MYSPVNVSSRGWFLVHSFQPWPFSNQKTSWTLCGSFLNTAVALVCVFLQRRSFAFKMAVSSQRDPSRKKHASKSKVGREELETTWRCMSGVPICFGWDSGETAVVVKTQDRWQMDVHPPQNAAIGYAPWRNHRPNHRCRVPLGETKNIVWLRLRWVQKSIGVTQKKEPWAMVSDVFPQDIGDRMWVHLASLRTATRAP